MWCVNTSWVRISWLQGSRHVQHSHNRPFTEPRFPLKHHSPCVAGVKSTQASPATPWPCSSQSCRCARCSRRCWRFVVLVNDGVAAARARLHFCDLLCKAGLCEQQCKAQACFLSEQTSNKHSSKRNRDNVEKWVYLTWRCWTQWTAWPAPHILMSPFSDWLSPTSSRWGWRCPYATPIQWHHTYETVLRAVWP